LTWVEPQVSKHVVVAMALGVGVLPVLDDVDEVDDCALGTTQFVRQVAACELQVIMQFVSVELCARRMFPSAAAPPAAAALIAATAASIQKPRIVPPRAKNTSAHHSERRPATHDIFQPAAGYAGSKPQPR
jgi:hypothetical protein